MSLRLETSRLNPALPIQPAALHSGSPTSHRFIYQRCKSLLPVEAVGLGIGQPPSRPAFGSLPGSNVGRLRTTSRPRFFMGRLLMTRTQSLFPSPASRSARRERGRKGKTTARGYGAVHQKLRKQLAPKVAGGGIRCWRCGELIRAGERWDLGHDDGDRRIYRGPEHVKCNRATAKRRRWQSREW